MTIDHSELKRCDLIVLSGRIDGSEAPKVEAKLNEIMEAGRYRFVIDLSNVTFVSSAFLRVLITTLKTVKRWNRGNVYLAAMPERIHEVFHLAGLLELFKIYPTSTEAVGDW